MKPTILSFLGLVAAQMNAPGISTNPGGVIPAGIRQPNLSGFNNPVILPARGGYAICVSGTVPVQATAQNIRLNFAVPANQSQVSETFLQFVTDGSPLGQQVAGGMQSVSDTYNISATMCMPANGTRYNTVQFLTHGVGFDRYYWDWAPGYSYADFAAVQGYATFFYDRLGVGRSSKPDPIQTIQAPLEVEIAAELIRGLRSARFGGMNFSRVVGTGHSFGSIITQAITARYPSLLDAAVLTGFTLNATGLPNWVSANNFAIASQNQPYRFSGLSNAFLVASSAISDQLAFFKSPGFDPTQLALADATKGTVTFGELFTVMAVTQPAANYTGAVAVVNGDADLPFCLGNCTFPSNKGAQVQPVLYPRARNISNSNIVLANTGHGLNLHYSATRGYQFIQDFIRANVQ